MYCVQGLVYEGRGADMSAEKLAFARPGGGLSNRLKQTDVTLAEVVRAVQPTTLIGAAGVRGTFDQDVIQALMQVYYVCVLVYVPDISCLIWCRPCPYIVNLAFFI